MTMTTPSRPSQADAPTRRLSRPATRAGLAAAAVVAVAVAVVVIHAAQGDDAPGAAPYTDAAATGRITLCAADGTALTSGSTLDQPFAATAVGTAPTGAGEAALSAYQPRDGLDATAWTGLQLTAGSTYTGSTPVVAVSHQATTLAQFVAGYPAVDDGFVQLRLLAPGATTYNALDLHIDGTRWTAVDAGDPAACR